MGDIFEHNKYHFIGIGGIGVSAIAKMLVLQGKQVTGSDNTTSIITEDLGKLGIKIYIGQRAENIPEGAEVVIYTVAIKEENPELVEARRRGLVCRTYPEALGELSKKMFTIAVSGTHGKTTTTAMIAHILKEAGLDPTVIVGSLMLGSDSNFLAGKSKYLVVEACEYKRSFLNLHPTILVITNIEEDHLDYYKDINDIKNAFDEMRSKVPESGYIITPEEYNKISPDISLLVPGQHNIYNAQAAVAVAVKLGIGEAEARQALSTFKGTWRRLEYKGEKDGNVFYDDYAHHPTEIRASLEALKGKYPGKQLVAVFEPHQQSRTKLLFNDFVEALKIADSVFIAPIFISREVADDSVSNHTLAEAVKPFTSAHAVKDANMLAEEIQKMENVKPLCVVLMGAGDIYKWTEKLL